MARAAVRVAAIAAATTAATGAKTCFVPHVSTGPPFSADEVAEIRTYFLRNIDVNGTGAVVAAPDHVTGPGGDYVFHWERDGALSMDVLLKTARSLSDVDAHMRHYVAWVKRLQDTPSPHSVDIFGEPKFAIPSGAPALQAETNSNGTELAALPSVQVFGGGWCRPQNDAAGLRARTLTNYARALLAAGRADFVRRHLWTGHPSREGGGVLKRDLDWVAANWRTAKGCDLWEEDKTPTAEYFWVQYTMRAALRFGSELAVIMDDPVSAAHYRETQEIMDPVIRSYWNGRYVYECKHREKDAAVIEAFNDGDIGDGLYAPLSEEVLRTVLTLHGVFCGEYLINQKDAAAGIPGILYGRYEGDTYNGGNPWVLLTATLAQLIYRQAKDAASASSVPSNIYDLLVEAYGIPGNLTGKALGDALMGAADGVLLRVKHHAVNAVPGPTTRADHTGGMHMAEQIGRNNGEMTSAEDLTWNYANLLKALDAREQYLASVGGTPPPTISSELAGELGSATAADQSSKEPQGLAWWVWALPLVAGAGCIALAAVAFWPSSSKGSSKRRSKRSTKVEAQSEEEVESPPLLQEAQAPPAAFTAAPVPVHASATAAYAPVAASAAPVQAYAYQVMPPQLLQPATQAYQAVPTQRLQPMAQGYAVPQVYSLVPSPPAAAAPRYG